MPYAPSNITYDRTTVKAVVRVNEDSSQEFTYVYDRHGRLLNSSVRSKEIASA
jgi:hypothetical protein